MKLRRIHLLGLVLAALVVVLAVKRWDSWFPSANENPVEHEFAEVVRTNFPRWDENHDGKLSPEEVLRQVENPRVTGKDAAAVAAIHQFQRPPTPQGGLPRAAASLDLAAVEGNSGIAQQFAFNDGLIRDTQREVFADGAPSLAGFRQGREGDCYWLAVLGAAVVRDPVAVRRMLEPHKDGAWELRFPGGARVLVPAVTDAEIALGAHAPKQGLWATYFEKGYGLLDPKHKGLPTSEDPIDKIGHGGVPNVTIRVLTGHRASWIAMHEELKNPGLEDRVGRVLESAHRERRLICCTTPETGKLPPGVTPWHVYAVLGYRHDARVVEVWNPHGNSFTPDSSPGLEHGYDTREGKFEIPLSEFVRVFGWLTWEEEVNGVRPAQIDIEIPEKAEVWIDGVKVPSKGGRSRYVTMPLSESLEHTYDVTARWHDGGKPVTRQQRVRVTGGAQSLVNFATSR